MLIVTLDKNVPDMRTALAYLLAPLTTPLLLAGLGVVHSHGRDFSWEGFGQFIAIGCVTAYPVAWGVGTIAFVLLRQTKRETMITYMGMAALGGVVYGLAIGWSSPGSERTYLAVLFALLAAPTGAVFHLIRGGNRSLRKSPEPVH